MVWSEPKFPDQYSSRIPRTARTLSGYLGFFLVDSSSERSLWVQWVPRRSRSSAPRSCSALTHGGSVRGFITSSREAAGTANHITDTSILPSPPPGRQHTSNVFKTFPDFFPLFFLSSSLIEQSCALWRSVKRTAVTGMAHPGLKVIPWKHKMRTTCHLLPPNTSKTYSGTCWLPVTLVSFSTFPEFYWKILHFSTHLRLVRLVVRLLKRVALIKHCVVIDLLLLLWSIK